MNEYVVETADNVYAKLQEDKVKEGDYITVMGPGQEDYQKFRVIIDKEGNKTTEIVAGFEDLMNPEEDEDDEGFEINEMDTSEDEDDKSMGGRKSRKRGRKSRKEVENRERVAENRERVAENRERVVENRERVVENPERVVESKL